MQRRTRLRALNQSKAQANPGVFAEPPAPH